MRIWMRMGGVVALMLGAAPGGAGETPAPTRSDFSVWKEIGENGTCAQYRDFVQSFPDSRLLALVEKKLLDCDRREQGQRSAKEEAAWRAAQAKGGCPGKRAFLTAFPDGGHAGEARDAVAECDRQVAAAQAQAQGQEAQRRQAQAQREAEDAKRKAEDAKRKALDAQHRAEESQREGARAGARATCAPGYWDAQTLAGLSGGYTWEGRSGMVRWREYYAPDGHLQGQARRNQERRPDYSGNWKLVDDRFCYCTGTCESYACRRVMQVSGCPGQGEAWTWDAEQNKKRSLVTGIYQGERSGAAW